MRVVMELGQLGPFSVHLVHGSRFEKRNEWRAHEVFVGIKEMFLVQRIFAPALHMFCKELVPVGV
jgi:hypothetical protein